MILKNMAGGSMEKIIKNGKLVTESEIYDADILIRDEKIAAIGKEFNESNAEIIDASNKLVLPGGIDAHVHLNLPMPGTVSSDDHYTGTKAAAFGGTTTVIDFANHDSPSLIDSFNAWQEDALPNVAVDYGLHQNFTKFNQDTLKEIRLLPDLGVTSIKMFTAYNGRMRLQDGEIFQAMRIAKEEGIISLIHAENGDLIDLLVNEAVAAGNLSPVWHARTRPAWGAVESVLRVSALSFAAGNAPLYIVHMNAKGEAEQLQYAYDNGLNIFGETCPQYLMFTEKQLERPDGSKWICSPPMRSEEDNEGLWQALAEGIINVVSTDHCPFLYDGSKPILYEGKPYQQPGKEMGKDDFRKVPNGLPGVGDRMPVLWTKGVVEGRITANRFVQLCCTNPAKIFGIYPQKGALLPGSDADIAIWNPDKIVQYGVNIAKHRTDYNLYEGMELTGFPEKVFLRGKLIVDGDNWLGKRGDGRFLKRARFEA